MSQPELKPQLKDSYFEKFSERVRERILQFSDFETLLCFSFASKKCAMAVGDLKKQLSHFKWTMEAGQTIFSMETSDECNPLIMKHCEDREWRDMVTSVMLRSPQNARTRMLLSEWESFCVPNRVETLNLDCQKALFGRDTSTYKLTIFVRDTTETALKLYIKAINDHLLGIFSPLKRSFSSVHVYDKRTDFSYLLRGNSFESFEILGKRFSVGSVMSPMTMENFEEIFEIPTIEKLHLDLVFPSDYRYKKRFPRFKEIHIGNGEHWVTVWSMVNMECETLIIDYCTLTAQHLNVFIKSWLKRGYDKLKMIRIDNFSIDVERSDLVDGIDRLYWKDLNPDEVIFKREDGRGALLQVEDRSFKFTVEPKLDIYPRGRKLI